jgi:hypothetical protein
MIQNFSTNPSRNRSRSAAAPATKPMPIIASAMTAQMKPTPGARNRRRPVKPIF